MMPTQLLMDTQKRKEQENFTEKIKEKSGNERTLEGEAQLQLDAGCGFRDLGFMPPLPPLVNVPNPKGIPCEKERK